jgi:glucose-6-phosphate dehydrogenase assembly protein OpcA
VQQSTPAYGIPLLEPVSSDAIEAALGAAWHQAAAADGTQPPARASVLSLVVCVVPPATARSAIDVVSRLSEQHPSRTLVLVPDLSPGAEDLKVWYSTGCIEQDGADQPVCGEQIVITARGTAGRHLPSLADQLILADLPSFLWWTGDLSFALEPLFDRLASLADRIVVDSAEFRSPGPAIVRLRRLARRHQSGVMSDLSWARLTPWRELVSQFFDSPALRARLGALDNVAIEYAPAGADGPAQSLLLLGWLGAVLNWVPDSDTVPVEWPAHGRFRRPDGKFVEFTAEPTAEEGASGLRQVVLRAGKEASFRVQRTAEGQHALTEAMVAGSPPIQRTAGFGAVDPSALLTHELMLFGRDQVYESALALAVTLAGGANQPHGR